MLKKLNLNFKLIGAIAFLAVALAFLGASMHTVTLSDADALIPVDKADQAGDFSLSQLSTGRAVRLSDESRRSPVVFTFSATWCQYCPVEMAHLQNYAKQYQGRIQFFAVDVGDPPAGVKAFVAKHGVTLPMLLDQDRTVARLYQVDSYPTMVIVDSHGRVRKYEDGYDPEMDKHVPGLLDQLLRDG